MLRLTRWLFGLRISRQLPVPPHTPLTIHTTQTHSEASRRTGWRRGSLSSSGTARSCAAVCPLVVCTARCFLEPCLVTVTFTTLSQVCTNLSKFIVHLPSHPAVPVSLLCHTLHASGASPLFNSYCLAIGDSVSCYARNSNGHSHRVTVSLRTRLTTLNV